MVHFSTAPLYLQVVKGHSPTESGLLMTPMMAGLLVTGIATTALADMNTGDP